MKNVKAKILLLSVSSRATPRDLLVMFSECTRIDEREYLADAYLRKCCTQSINGMRETLSYLNRKGIEATYFACLTKLGQLFVKSPRSDQDEQKRVIFVSWLVKQDPGDPILLHPATYSFVDPWRSKIGSIWTQVVQANNSNVRVLKNAATFYLYHEPRLSKTLLKRCQAIEADNPYWSNLLAIYFDKRR